MRISSRYFPVVEMSGVMGIAAIIGIAGFVTSNALGRFLWNNPAYTLTVIDFETDGDGNELAKGQIIDDEFVSLGLTITTEASSWTRHVPSQVS